MKGRAGSSWLIRIACSSIPQPRTSVPRPRSSMSQANDASTSTPAPSGPHTTDAATPFSRLRYADVGINLSDATYAGVYHGKTHHSDDTAHVLSRAVEAGCEKFMVTGSDLEESRKAIALADRYPGRCYATVGVHPCSVGRSFEPSSEEEGGKDKAEDVLEQLKQLALEGKRKGTVVAFGEIGLDYDRLYLAEKEPQLKYFAQQLDLATTIQLPLFLHMRAACTDFETVLKPRLPSLRPRAGLVHSFTGTEEEMRRLVELGLDIGVNGCSLKTEENIGVVRAIPLDRLQIETDGPWCEMRGSHASARFKEGAPVLPKAVKKEKWEAGMMVKGRNESVAISHVAHVVAGIKGLSVEEVAEAAWVNSTRMFALGEEKAG